MHNSLIKFEIIYNISKLKLSIAYIQSPLNCTHLYNPLPELISHLEVKYDYSAESNIQYFQQKMTQTNSHNEIDHCFEILKSQFPGINLERLPHHLLDIQKLSLLSRCIQYKVPKSHIPHRIAAFEEQLFQLYLNSTIYRDQQLSERILDRAELSNLQVHNQENLDVQEACRAEKQDENQPKALRVQQIAQLFQTFNFDNCKDVVNSSLLSQIDLWNQKKTCEHTIDNINSGQKQKFDAKKRESFQNGGHNKKWEKKKIETNNSKEREVITIQLGSNIPLETKLMRSQVKRLSSISFSVLSQEKEKNLASNEQLKLQISFLINQLANQNLDYVYETISPYIINEQILCTNMINQLLFVCKQSSPEAIQVYSQLAVECSRIPKSQFLWSVQTNSQIKLNNFHWKLGCLLQQQFEKCFKEVEENPKQFINICRLIANLIKKKKFSRKIFIEILDRIILQILIQKQNTEYLFDAIMGVIITFGKEYEGFQSKNYSIRKFSEKTLVKIRQYLTENQLSNSLINLLISIKSKLPSETTRIEKLLQNLKQKLNQTVNKQEPEKLRQQINLQMNKKSPNVEYLTKLFEIGENKEQIFEILLKISYDCEKSRVNSNIRIIKDIFELNDENKETFKLVWNKIYTDLYIEECDYPYMTEALSQLILYFTPEDISFCFKELDQDNPDYEDCEFFMKKLQKKLQHYAVSQQIIF